MSLASDVLAHEALYSLVLKRQEILGRGTVCAHSRTAVGVILDEDLQRLAVAGGARYVPSRQERLDC